MQVPCVKPLVGFYLDKPQEALSEDGHSAFQNHLDEARNHNPQKR